MAAWPSFGELATLLVTAAGIDVWEMFHTPTIANSRQAKKKEKEANRKRVGERGERSGGCGTDTVNVILCGRKANNERKSWFNDKHNTQHTTQYTQTHTHTHIHV